MLIDNIPINNCIFPLLHVEIWISNKIIKSYFDWINDWIELPSMHRLLLINNKTLLINECDT